MKAKIKKLKNFLFGEIKTQPELVDFLRESQTKKIIDHDTLAMLEGVLLFSKMTVRDIMLPRNQMVSVDITLDFEQVIKVVAQTGHSRFPVQDDDEITGILHAKDSF